MCLNDIELPSRTNPKQSFGECDILRMLRSIIITVLLKIEKDVIVNLSYAHWEANVQYLFLLTCFFCCCVFYE